MRFTQGFPTSVSGVINFPAETPLDGMTKTNNRD